MVLTARTAYRASFINYDHATEFLVYAHGARGPKDILAQVEEISQRTTKGKDIVVAYSGDAQYPYLWYFRDYPNVRWFGDKPTRDLRDAPMIIAGEDVFGKMEPVVGDNFVMYEYMRLWWPMQDYWNLTWERIWDALGSPDYRQALWDIWLNRDYTRYAKLTSSTNLTLENWQPSARIRLYIRKDIVAQIWNYGVQPSIVTTAVKTDPYQAKMIQLAPDPAAIGQTGTRARASSRPRAVWRLPRMAASTWPIRATTASSISPRTGTLINAWGTFADITKGEAPGGTFNEPWDVAVAQDGTVFVSDTWNHRIQVFTPDGKFIRTWGYFGQAEKPDGFLGAARAWRSTAAGASMSPTRATNASPSSNRTAPLWPSSAPPGWMPGQFDEPIGRGDR